MGIEKDFIMRQIRMLFEVLSKILRYRKKGEKGKALDQINYFYACLKVDVEFHSMEIEKLIEYLEKEKNLNNEQIELLAFVLKEQGELSTTENERLDFYRKSYFLLAKVDRESTSFSMDRQMKITELKEWLN